MGPRGLVAGLCLANLVAGAGLGVVLDRTLLVHARREGGRHGGFRGGPGGPGGDVNRLVERLQLDEAQAEKVRSIFAARRPLFGEVMKEIRPRLEALRLETDAEVRKVLRPEQAARLDELRREWEQNGREGRERERREGPGGREGPPAPPPQKEGLK